MSVLQDNHHFPIWCMNFEGQLRKIHQEFEDENGENFRDLDFIDFCILVYTERPELIWYGQN